MTQKKKNPVSLLLKIKSKTHSAKLPCKAEGGIHHYKVGYVPNGGKRTPSPAINLGGHWLAEFGFITGGRVTVTARQGVLVIKTADPCL